MKTLYSEDKILQSSEVIVIFEEHQEVAAKEIAKIYPSIKSELGETLKWRIDFKPTVLLDKGGKTIKRNTGTNMFVGYAMPNRNLIVLDTSRVYAKPFSLKSTLKHELCHLLINRNIENPPRWIDEGVCQWISGGIDELLREDSKKILQEAIISNNLLSIRELINFPQEKTVLAYEESKSIVEYIEREFGKEGLLQILAYLKEGYSIDDSLQKGILNTTLELEEKWLKNVKKKKGWLPYLSNNLYGILFFFAALITVYGFMRMLKKKKEQLDEPLDVDLDGKN
ncbi:MAG: hypothetical protein HXY47_06560 [Nitrospirae bacterium]|nr:hypothetical protein [Nitrospirota bacterium]